MYARLFPVLVLLIGYSSYAQLDCTQLIVPLESSNNSPAFTSVQWTNILSVVGYQVTLGTSPFENDILEQTIYTDNFTEQIDFPPNTTIYVTITPFNDAEFAVGCEQLSFTTTEECSHQINEVTDISLCYTENTENNEIVFDVNGIETQLIGVQEDLVVNYYDSEGNQIDLTALIPEANENQFTIWARATDTFECFKETSFKLTLTRLPEIDSRVDVSECDSFILPDLGAESQYYTGSNGTGSLLQAGDILTDSQRIYIFTGEGSCSNESTFELTINTNYCEESISEVPYPKFFTPNGDGVNDFWQLTQPFENTTENTLIHIFDRGGRLVHQSDVASIGWDGNYNGEPLPSSDYWFSVTLGNNHFLKGHFALKR